MRLIIMILSVMLTVVSQTLWKVGAGSARIEGDGIIPIIFGYLKSPLIIIGFGLSGIAALMWAYALSKLEFSYVSFISSLSYIFVLLISIFFFKETISPIRWAGCGVILIGVLMVLRS